MYDMIYMKFKFGLTSLLIEKLCLVQYVFRKNGLPDDVFWYMLEPLFKTNKNDVSTWYEDKFVSLYRYDYDFNIIIKHVWADTTDKLINHLSTNNNSKIFDEYRNSDWLYLIVYDYEPVYNVFHIRGDNICAHTFYNNYDNDNVDDYEINRIKTYNAHNAYLHYRGTKNNKLKKLGIKGKHIDLLKKMF